jgi:hypothetical protein
MTNAEVVALLRGGHWSDPERWGELERERAWTEAVETAVQLYREHLVKLVEEMPRQLWGKGELINFLTEDKR